MCRGLAAECWFGRTTMATANHIRNPVEWSADLVVGTIQTVGRAGQALRLPQESVAAGRPAIRKIAFSDLREVLARGIADLGAYRTDAVFLAAIYPLVGIVLAAVALNYKLVPLLFPLA